MLVVRAQNEIIAFIVNLSIYEEAVKQTGINIFFSVLKKLHSFG